MHKVFFLKWAEIYGIKVCDEFLSHRELFKLWYNHVLGDSEPLAEHYKKIADEYKKLKDYDKALKYYEFALNKYESLGSGYEFKCSGVLNNIGEIYYARAKSKKGSGKDSEYYKKALEYYEKALIIWIVKYDDLDSYGKGKLAGRFIKCGNAYAKLGYTEKGLELHKKAYFVYKIIKNRDKGSENQFQRLRKVLEEKAPEFLANDEGRDIIRKMADFDSKTLEIKSQIQYTTLNKLHKTLKKVDSLIDEAYLKTQLGNLFSEENLKIAKMLCFEAINVGIMNQKTKVKNYKCAKEFAQLHPKLVQEIAKAHPEYFVDGRILKACQDIAKIDDKLVAELLHKTDQVSCFDNNSTIERKNGYKNTELKEANKVEDSRPTDSDPINSILLTDDNNDLKEVRSVGNNSDDTE